MKRRGLRLGQTSHTTNNLAVLVQPRLRLVKRVEDAIAAKHLPQVFRGAHDPGRLAKRERVVTQRQRGFVGSKRVDFEVHGRTERQARRVLPQVRVARFPNPGTLFDAPL